MKKDISFEDAKSIMDHIAHKISNEVGIDELNLAKCWESSFAIQRFCYDKLNACPLKTTGLGFTHLTHCFDVVSVSPKYSFIVDLTYRQFNADSYPLGIINGEKIYIDGPAKYLTEKNKKELETIGYIPLTKENLSDYLYSFMRSYKEKFDLDEQFVLSETLEIINIYGITLCDINDFTYSTVVNNNEKQK